MITHTVFFKLLHPSGGAEEATFFSRLRMLREIAVVRTFKIVKEVSPKNEFDYGLVMQFDNEADLRTYNQHPEHVQFVNSFWIPEVRDFLEIDYVSL